jgi:hypothetical protein
MAILKRGSNRFEKKIDAPIGATTEVWVTLVASRSRSHYSRTGDSKGLLRGARSDRLVRVELAACAREPTDRMPDSS